MGASQQQFLTVARDKLTLDFTTIPDRILFLLKILNCWHFSKRFSLLNKALFCHCRGLVPPLLMSKFVSLLLRINYCTDSFQSWHGVYLWRYYPISLHCISLLMHVDFYRTLECCSIKFPKHGEWTSLW